MRVIAPDLPIDPDEALAMLRDLVATERPDIVIGTSMGGMFAQQLYDCRKILVNPAFHVSRTMRRQIGVCVLSSIREKMVQRPIRLPLNYVIDTRKWNVTNSMG